MEHLWRTGDAHGLIERVDGVGGQVDAGGREHLQLQLLGHRGLQHELLHVAAARVAHLRRDQCAQAGRVARRLAHEREHHLHAALIECCDRRDRVRRRAAAAVRQRALGAALAEEAVEQRACRGRRSRRSRRRARLRGQARGQGRAQLEQVTHRRSIAGGGWSAGRAERVAQQVFQVERGLEQ